MLALAQAVTRAQGAMDARSSQLATALNSLRKSFSLAGGRLINVPTQPAQTGASNVIPVSSMVRMHRYRLVNVEVSFEVSTLKSRTRTPSPPHIFRLDPGRKATKQQATLRITAGPRMAAEFAIDGVKYGELILNPESTSQA